MVAYASIGVALDKSKLASDVTYISLLEIDIINLTTGAIDDTIRLAHNNESYSYNGYSYVAMPMEFDIAWSKGELPQVSLTLTDVTLAIHGALEDVRGATDCPVRLLIISSASPTKAEITESFTIISAASDSTEYSVTLTLGAENPLGMRWPQRLMFRNRCFWKYKGTECKYAGGLTSCDKTLDGANGCKVHANNVVNFGGFPGIRRNQYR